jgi:hypothetical protein
VRAVHVHGLVRELQPGYAQALHGVLGNRLVYSSAGYDGPKLGITDTWLLWLRDFHPTTVRDPDGTLRMVTSLSTDARRSGYSHSSYVPFPPPKPDLQPFRIPGQSLGVEWRRVTPMPLLHEPGNFVTDGTHAVVTTKLGDDNAAPRGEAHLHAAGYRARPREETLALFSKAMGLEESHVIEIPRLPGEATGHADTQVLAVGPGRFLVPQVRDEVFPLLASPEESALGRAVQAHLESVAAQLEAKGLTVDRVPMMPPVSLSADPLRPGETRGVFYTPTNTPLVDTGTAQQAHLPTWKPTGFPPGYAELNDTYQHEWGDYFRARGFTPVAHDTTELGHSYGLLRCLSWQEP